MSCNNTIIWIKHLDIDKYDYNTWFKELRNTDFFSHTNTSNFDLDNIESELFHLINFCNISKLAYKVSWVVFELNNENIQKLINHLKYLIHESIFYGFGEQLGELKDSTLKDVFGYVDEDDIENLPEKLCWLLKELRHAQKVLSENKEYSFIVNLNY